MSWPQGRVAEFFRWLGDLRRTVSWIHRGLGQALGRGRLLWLMAQTAVGSAAISLIGFSIIFVIRSADTGGSQSFRGIAVPQLPLPTLFVAIGVGGLLGAGVFYRSQQSASNASVEYANYLRTELAATMTAPESRGWQTTLAERPQQVVLGTVVSGVREISIAAREVIRVVGPISTAAITVTGLFVLEPVISAILTPVALALAIPMYISSRQIQDLNTQFESHQSSARDDIFDNIDNLIAPDRNPDDALPGFDEARTGDEVTHERMLLPARMRAITVVSTAYFAGLVLALFLLRLEDGAQIEFLRLMIYIIVLRLAVNAIQQIAIAIMNVARRGVAIERYRSLEQDLLDFADGRSQRSEETSPAFPGRLVFAPSADERPLRLRQGTVTVVLTNAAPTHATVDEVTVALEAALERDEQVVDLLANTEVAIGPAEVFGRSGAANNLPTDDDPTNDDPTDDEPTDNVETHQTRRFPVRVVAAVDLERACAEAASDQFTFVITRFRGSVWRAGLPDEAGLMVIHEGKLREAGTIGWAMDNKQRVRHALSNRPALPLGHHGGDRPSRPRKVRNRPKPTKRVVRSLLPTPKATDNPPMANVPTDAPPGRPAESQPEVLQAKHPALPMPGGSTTPPMGSVAIKTFPEEPAEPQRPGDQAKSGEPPEPAATQPSRLATETPPRKQFTGPQFDPERKARLEAMSPHGLIFGDADHELLEFPCVDRILVLTTDPLSSQSRVDHVISVLSLAWSSPDGRDLDELVGPTFRAGRSNRRQKSDADDDAYTVVSRNPVDVLSSPLDRLQIVLCDRPERTLTPEFANASHQLAGVVAIVGDELRFALPADTYLARLPQIIESGLQFIELPFIELS